MSDATNPPKPANWRDDPIYQAVIDLAEALERQGYVPDDISDAFVGVGLHIADELHGSAHVASRLLMLADRFATDAEMIRRAIVAGAAGPAN